MFFPPSPKGIVLSPESRVPVHRLFDRKPQQEALLMYAPSVSGLVKNSWRQQQLAV